mmetsp:Transcript_29248/g.69631  ORF Transcript_29248/g.69631 Transcript_29248/m.69631 type:complete len:126 (-) Transcript_29248:105-482(-)
MEQFKLFGTVKEVGVDDEGLAEFHNEHFDFPLFKDDGLVLYNDFFGKRSIKLTTYNPMKLYRGYKDMNKRLKEKKLDGNLKGEGMIQGGLILFDKNGDAKYAYEEEIGSPINIDDVVAALKDLSD